jgi:hypothetical protein
MNIELFLSELSKGGKALPSVDTKYCDSHAIRYAPTRPDFYVEPALDAPDELSPILLISAPAAVGKTTLAHYISSKLTDAGQGVLYIPLQEANIGHDFFTGRLAGVFPNLTKRQILDSVFRGEIVLLFDGYDEVTMRSDQIDRNKEFIGEIKAELAEFQRLGGKPNPCIAFLFRSVFADFGVFDDIKNIASEISVLFFDVDRRKQFLNQYLDSKARNDSMGKPSKGHLSKDFLDGFENSLASAKDDSSAFFGHAIVLSAFGDFLHEQEEENAARLASSLAEDETVEAVAVDLLTKIIQLILEREEGKFPVQEYSAHISSFEPYSSLVQEKMLFGVATDEFLKKAGKRSDCLTVAIKDLVEALEKHPEYAALDRDVQVELTRNYRKELESRITHHPFIDLIPSAKTEEIIPLDKIAFRNPVYREYYLAKVIVSNPKGAWELDAARNDYSHYLALFFLGSVENRDISEYQAFLFSLISLFATSSSGNDFQFKMEWKHDANKWEGTIDASNIQVKPFFVADPLLVVDIPLHGILQNATFSGNAECELEISGPGPGNTFSGNIVLTDCVFAASKLYLSASAIKFDNCELICKDLHFTDVIESLDGLETLAIRGLDGANVPFTLSDYVANRWTAALEDSKNFGGVSGETLFKRKLSKILLRFRRHHRADYGCHDKKFRSRILSDNQDIEVADLSKFLFEQGFLSEMPGLIVMDQDKFSERDIHYAKQNEITFGPKSGTLYSELIASAHGTRFKG